MKKRKIVITESDKQRLEELIAVAGEFSHQPRNDLAALAGELAKAEVVPSQKVPPDVVTMNSKVLLRDVATGEEMTYTLVFPKAANIDDGAISVLAPVGTAILGYRQGNVVAWPVPSGILRMRLEKILSQPEAAGHYHL